MPDLAQTASTSSHIPMCYKDILNTASLRSPASHSPFPTLLHARLTQKQGAFPCQSPHWDNIPVTTSTPPRSSTLPRHQCPSKPHGSPPGEPTAVPRGALRAQRALTAATAPGCSGREARAGCAAGCGSAVCRDRRKGSGLGVQSNDPICSPAGCTTQSWVLWLAPRGQ